MYFFENEYSELGENKSIDIQGLHGLNGGMDDFENEFPLGSDTVPSKVLESNTTPTAEKEPSKEGSKEKDEPKQKSDEPQGLNKIEQKRMNCKMRTRKSRDRKKMYIEELELKVKDLERENFRLQHLLLIYRKQSWSSVSNESTDLLEEIEKHRKKLEETFVDPKTGKYNERASTIKCSEYFKQTAEKVMESHKKVMNLSFEMIIDHLHPFVSFYYWKHFDKGYNASYELIKKFNKRTKFEKPEFIKNNNFTELDQLIASFNPDKRQYRYIREVMLPKEREVKQKFDGALELLLRAKEAIAEANAELHAFRCFNVKSEIISDKQMFDSMLTFNYQVGAERKLKSIWNIDVEPKSVFFDLTQDKLYGNLAKKNLPKNDRILEYKYDCFMKDQGPVIVLEG